MRKADVIIPVYKPKKKLVNLLDALMAQEEVSSVILMNTEKKYFDAFLKEKFSDLTENTSCELKIKEWMKEGKLQIHHLSKASFDHGKTRNLGVKFSDDSFFILMTDDAIPATPNLVKNLLKAFDDEQVAITYGRQLANKDSGTIEKYTRTFNYPDQSVVKSAKDIETMGIKAFFASNVCCAYRKEAFEKLGGFTDHTIFNEDMIFARKALDAGYTIAYVADATVYHSHNYSGREQFKRNFDLGVSHADYPEIFGGIKTESEGIRLVGNTCGYLFRVVRPWLIVKLFWQSGCKYIGYFLGKRYKRLSLKTCRHYSMNAEYWDREISEKE